MKRWQRRLPTDAVSHWETQSVCVSSLLEESYEQTSPYSRVDKDSETSSSSSFDPRGN